MRQRYVQFESKTNNSKVDNKQIKVVSEKIPETKNEIENTKVKDLVKNIEYTSVDQKGPEK